MTVLRRQTHAGDAWQEYDELTELKSSDIFIGNINDVQALIGDSAPRTILEVGCGNGVFAERLLASLPPDTSITIVEPNKFLGKIACDKLGSATAHVKWVCTTAESFFPTDRRFDLIISTRTVHHLDNPFDVIIEMHNALAPSGVIYIFDLLRPETEVELQQWLERRTKLLGHPSTQKMAEQCLRASYSEKEIKELFKTFHGKLKITKDWFKRWQYSYRLEE